MIKQSKTRSLVKTFSWRVTAATLTFIIVYGLSSFITSLALAITVGLFDFFFKTYLYYIHERLWEKIKWGLSLDKKDRGCCIWLTGLPCSGKTTIAKRLKEKLEDELRQVEFLDGDIIRDLPGWNLGFSKEDREENINRIARISGFLSRKSIVICSFVSPYRDTRSFVKSCNNNFIEVYVNASARVCAERDVKGMWAKAQRGEITGFTGWDDPYEPPIRPDVTVNTEDETIDESVDKIMTYLKSQDWFNS